MAETNGLLNRRTGKSGTEGSNPSVSATASFDLRIEHSAGAARVFRGDTSALADKANGHSPEAYVAIVVQAATPERPFLDCCPA